MKIVATTQLVVQTMFVSCVLLCFVVFCCVLLCLYNIVIKKFIYYEVTTFRGVKAIHRASQSRFHALLLLYFVNVYFLLDSDLLLLFVLR